MNRRTGERASGIFLLAKSLTLTATLSCLHS
jgi:hypothetical protein